MDKTDAVIKAMEKRLLNHGFEVIGAIETNYFVVEATDHRKTVAVDECRSRAICKAHDELSLGPV